jgi:hypothetical protein
MKKLSFFSFALFSGLAIFFDISAQPHIDTPKGKTVYVTYMNEGSPEWLAQIYAYDDSIITAKNYDAVIVGYPTRKYNCHFYAWYSSEIPNFNGDKYFLQEDSETTKFLEDGFGNGDGSFIPAVHPEIADKILITQWKINTPPNYLSSDSHSMIFDPDPNSNRDYKSKWADGSLVKHGKYDHPYDKNPDDYYPYARTTHINFVEPTTNIPEVICNTDVTYNVIVDPHFKLMSIYPSSTSLLDIYEADISNKTIRLKAKSNTSGGSFTLTFRIEAASGEPKEYSKIVNIASDPSNVWATFEGPMCMCAWDSYYIRTQYIQPGLTFNWQFQYGYVENVYPGCISVTPYMDGGYVTLTTNNGCGVTNTGSVLYPFCSWCSEYYMVYPNPSSTQVYIETTKEGEERKAKAEIEMKKLSAQEVSKITLPNLVDYKYHFINQKGEVKLMGNAFGGKALIDVSFLQPGVYFIIIENGSKPESHQLIIN